MSTTDIDPPSGGIARAYGGKARRDDWTEHRSPGLDVRGMLRRCEAWLDERGCTAWIVAMILGFVFAWPVGLFLLVYIIWSNRMFSSSCRKSRRRDTREMDATARAATRPSGNNAFDAYKAATLRRLEDEQGTFEAFLERLREAKDKAEFDQFMEDRARSAAAERESRRDEDRDDRSDWKSGPMRPTS